RVAPDWRSAWLTVWASISAAWSIGSFGGQNPPTMISGGQTKSVDGKPPLRKLTSPFGLPLSRALSAESVDLMPGAITIGAVIREVAEAVKVTPFSTADPLINTISSEAGTEPRPKLTE